MHRYAKAERIFTPGYHRAAKALFAILRMGNGLGAGHMAHVRLA
ncbi:MAG TPA: hypothetical protein VJ942_01230 [Roseovarius sp.]|nr:hypothetical protein [Roseovarius sp.]